MSVNDCCFNLNILKEFCQSALAWNPFHFAIEDILYLHESLQPNINVFLADLFYFFEILPQKNQVQSPQELISPTQRRFMPIQGIPELRAQNLANRPQYPPKTSRFLQNLSQKANSMVSVDSLLANSAADSLNSKLQFGQNTTNFSKIKVKIITMERFLAVRSLAKNYELRFIIFTQYKIFRLYYFTIFSARPIATRSKHNDRRGKHA